MYFTYSSHKMHRIIFYCLIQYLLFFTSSVEPLRGTKVVKADNREFPFVASLQNSRGNHFCSGTLITDTHVITSEQCLYGERPESVWVVLGETDLTTANVRYAVSTWITSMEWATFRALQIQRNDRDIAIITLNYGIIRHNVRPVRLTNLNKQQVQGKTAKIIGWRFRNTKVAKATVNILSDHDCERNVQLITNNFTPGITIEQVLCTSAKPYVLLQEGDTGGPLLDEFGAIIGVHYSTNPRNNFTWGNFSDNFLHPYKVNLHSNVAYHDIKHFIVNYTGYHH